MKPDRVVLGVDSEYAGKMLRDLYAPFVRTGNAILIMDVPRRRSPSTRPTPCWRRASPS